MYSSTCGSSRQRHASHNKQLPASFAPLTTTITARIREPRRAPRTLYAIAEPVLGGIMRSVVRVPSDLYLASLFGVNSCGVIAVRWAP